MAEYTILQVKRDSTLNWYASNPRLALGEPGVDMDLHRFKIGNGIDRWNELPYMDDDLYKLLDEQEQKTVDYVQDLLNRMADNKRDADQKYNDATTEIRNTSRELTGRMSAVEDAQEEFQQNLTERQQEFEEAVTGDFEDTKAEVQAGLDEFAQTRDRLNTRMDAIVGQATEDTEILDARMDARYQRYSNLGTNIRNIHQQLLEAESVHAADKAEVDAEIAGLKNVDIQEHQAREQITTGHDTRLSKLEDDTSKLFAKDESLQEQTDTNAEEILNTALILADEIFRTREEISRVDSESTTEQQTRMHEDAELSARIDREFSERIAEDESISARIDAQNHELEHERRQRIQDVGELVRQADELAGAVVESTVLIDQTADKLRTETAERIKADEDLSRIHGRREEFLQEQISETAAEILDLNIRLYQEKQNAAQTDKNFNAKVEALDDELKYTRQTLQIEAQQAKTQSDTVTDALLGLVNELEHEHDERVEADGELAEYIDRNTDTLDERLREEIHTRTTENAKLTAEIQPVGEALLHESLDRYEEYSRLKNRLEHFEHSSLSWEEFQNEQISDLAASSMQQALRLYHETEQRREDIHVLTERIASEEQTRSEFDAQTTDDFKHEKQARIAKDEALQEQTDINADALLNTIHEIDSLNERVNIRIDREIQARATSTEKTQEQTDDLVAAVWHALVNGYRAREKINIRIANMEAALVEAGVLDESDIPRVTDAEVDELIEDIFSGNVTPEALVPDNEEEAEFLEDIYNIFNP